MLSKSSKLRGDVRCIDNLKQENVQNCTGSQELQRLDLKRHKRRPKDELSRTITSLFVTNLYFSHFYFVKVITFQHIVKKTLHEISPQLKKIHM